MTPKRASITRFRSIRRSGQPRPPPDRAGLDNLAKFFHLDIAQVARPARALAVGEAIRSLFVEPVNPVPQGLAIHPTDPCGLSTAHAIVDRRKRQQTAALPGILATAGEFTKVAGIKVATKRNTGWHGPLCQHTETLAPLGITVGRWKVKTNDWRKRHDDIEWVSCPALGVEERSDETPSAGASRARPAPDPEVVAKPKRRQFTAQYRLRILEEADRCTELGEVGRLLRREGLYSSHLTTWRKARRKGSLQGLTSNKRGAKPAMRNPLDAKVRELETKVVRLEKQLHTARTILDVPEPVKDFETLTIAIY